MAKKVFHDNVYSMGTRFDVVFPSLEYSKAQNVFAELKKELYRLEKMLSRFDEESFLALINNKAFESPVILPDEIWNILMLCKKYNELTEGAFDITIGPLMKLWNIKHGYRMNLFEPNKEQIKEVLSIVGFQNIIFNQEEHSIAFSKEGMEIDFGGFGKGYALEKTKEILSKHESQDVFISFGESSILGMGEHPQGDNWKTGITHLIEKNDVIYTFNLNDQAISNSGANITEEGFNKYGHIINPLTGYPVKGNINISVFSSSPLEAEVLSSALLVKNLEEKKEILKNFPGCKAVEFEYGKDNDVNVRELN